jgi:YD repeat-containing protein
MLTIWFGLPEAYSDAKNSTAHKRERVDLGTKDFSNESQFTGDVAFSIPLARMGGVDVMLRYNSNVHTIVGAENRYSPPGWVGVGWSLNLGSIHADINNTKDPSDDRYFYVGPDFSSELIPASGNEYFLRDYRHWKIERLVTEGTLVGWTIILEDGTIQRFGNPSGATVSGGDVSPYATRFLVGWGNLISRTSPNYGTPSLIPYQWDLSDIEDVNGDHVSVTYAHMEGTLAGGELSYTKESYPAQIKDRSDRVIEFQLYDNALVSIEPGLVGDGQVKTETRTLRRVLLKDNANVTIRGYELCFETKNVLARSLEENKKTYLSGLVELDREMQPAKSTLFEYAGVTSELASTDFNPGALTKITMPEGGTIEYTYGLNSVVSDWASQLSVTGDIESSRGAGCLASDPDFWSLAGTDFFVVRRSGFLEAFRWTPGNCFGVDLGFPFNSFAMDESWGFWVNNDYVVAEIGTELRVAKRSGERWETYVVAQGIDPGQLQMLGLGKDYFVFATGCANDIGNVVIARYSNDGTWLSRPMGPYPIGINFPVQCGTRFCTASGSMPVWVYNPVSSQWVATKDAGGYTAGPDYLVEIVSSSVFNVFRYSGGTWDNPSTVGNTPKLDDDPIPCVNNASIVPGDNFFLIRGTDQYSVTRVYIATNTIYGWVAKDLLDPDLLSEAILDQYTGICVGPDFVAVTWRNNPTEKWKVGVTRYVDGQWVVSTVVDLADATPLENNSTMERCTPFTNGSTLFTEVYNLGKRLEVHSLTFHDEIWDLQSLLNVDPLVMQAGYSPLKPCVQPGHDFTVCVFNPNLDIPNDEMLWAWKRTNGERFREVFAADIDGGFDYPVLSKIKKDGCGAEPLVTSFVHSDGVYDDYMNAVHYGTSTEYHPGSTGRTVTQFYNDLPLPAPDYWYLDGRDYRRDEFSASGTSVECTLPTWEVILPEATTTTELLRPIEDIGNGGWWSHPSGSIVEALDDGPNCDPLDYVATDGIEQPLQIRMSSVSETLAPGSDVVVTVYARGRSGSQVPFIITLWQSDGIHEYCVAEDEYTTGSGSTFGPFTLTVPSGDMVHAQRLVVKIDLISGPIEIAHLKIDVQSRTDGRTSFSQLANSTATLEGVISTKSFEYCDANGLVKKMTESASAGSNRVTETKYAFERAAFSEMGSTKHMYSQIYSTTVKNGESDVEAKKWTVWGNPDGIWRPREEWVWRGDGNEIDETAPEDPESGIEVLKVSTVASYDAHGNPRQLLDANNVWTTTLWGHNASLPIASIINARSTQEPLGAECSYIGFESGTTNPSKSSDEDYWLLQPGLNLTSTDAHTGSYSQRLPGWDMTSNPSCPVYGPTRDFCPPDLPGQRRKYIASCWVKTEAGFADGAARLIVHTKANSGDNAEYPPNHTEMVFKSVTTGDTYGQWVCLEAEIDVKTIRQLCNISDSELLRVRVYPANYDATHYMLVDDIRVYPSDGIVKSTTTYDPSSLLPTSESDAAGVFTVTSYDDFGRPVQERDNQGSLLNEYSYHYSRDGATGCFSTEDPNRVEITSYRSDTDVDTQKVYFDGLGREIQVATSFGDEDIISQKAYDLAGRPWLQYKPYVTDLQGLDRHKYDINYASHVIDYYSSLGISLGVVPYSETKYYSDPLNRIRAQGAPGYVFAADGGHDQQMSYYGDNTNHWYVTESADEQGNITRISKDLFGNTVKSEILMGNVPALITSFEYDILGNLKKSTPPKEESDSTSYDYTTRSELKKKDSPDAEPVRYLYDGNGNLRFSMDGVQAGSRFTYNKYDKLNRLIEVGEHAPALHFTQENAYGELPGEVNTVHSAMTYDSKVSSDQRNLQGRLSQSRAYRQGLLASTTTYSYDDFGRIEWIEHALVGSSSVRIQYTYDRQGNITKKGFVDLGNAIDRLYTYYEYDLAGRLSAIYTSSIDDETGKTLAARFTYTASNQVHQLTLGELPAQTVDYSYNERDWLRTINDVGDLGEDKFGEQIHYNTSPATVATVDQYNGNIAAVEYYNSGLGEANVGRSAYSFGYDGANRLTSAQFNQWIPPGEYLDREKYSLPTINYDPNGNITRLVRNGANGSAKDDLAYTYGAGNRLDHVTHGVTPKYYSYDANGNVTRDDFREVTAATYDYRNLPVSVTKTGGGTISYSYDGSGNRIRKTVGSLDERYILGADGQTEAVYNADGLLFWNIIAGGKVIGKLVP